MLRESPAGGFEVVDSYVSLWFTRNLFVVQSQTLEVAYGDHTTSGSLIPVEKPAVILSVNCSLAIIRFLDIGPPVRLLQVPKARLFSHSNHTAMKTHRLFPVLFRSSHGQRSILGLSSLLKLSAKDAADYLHSLTLLG